ncbi:uncharacterized protein LOC142333923 [Lycorma delicatula]|uniref:uncharacterized protein LOC142333923 n=1 Tax=Lycorma delicatula TaxID=130591 RepID=UPI003F50FBFD
MINYPLDVNYDDVETDPLAFEESNFIKSENLKIKNELTQELDISLNVEALSQVNDNVKTEELDIDDEYLQKFKTEEVELPSCTQELDISLNVEALSQVNDNVKTEELDIDDEYLQKFKTEEVELRSCVAK